MNLQPLALKKLPIILGHYAPFIEKPIKFWCQDERRFGLKTYPDEHHIMQINNAAFHTSKKLIIPDNISLLPQPTHSPETNPIERIWAWFKSQLKHLNFSTLQELKDYMESLLNNTIPERIQTPTYWPHIQGAVKNL